MNISQAIAYLVFVEIGQNLALRANPGEQPWAQERHVVHVAAEFAAKFSDVGGEGTALKEVVAQLDASTPKEERNTPPEQKADHFPKIAFEGSQGQGRKVVFTVPHENLSPPSFSSIMYMWIKDESSGAILTAKKFSPSDPNLVITAFASSGQKLTAASKDDKFGIWSGTFVVP